MGEPKITIGMKFGTEANALAEMKYRSEADGYKHRLSTKPNCIIEYDKKGNEFARQWSRTTQDGKALSGYDSPYGFRFASTKQAKNGMYDTIICGKQIAYDLNGNGIVDEGEIFG